MENKPNYTPEEIERFLKIARRLDVSIRDCQECRIVDYRLSRVRYVQGILTSYVKNIPENVRARINKPDYIPRVKNWIAREKEVLLEILESKKEEINPKNITFRI